MKPQSLESARVMDEVGMKLRSDLPPLPSKMRALPVDARGYPVPWFVAWFDGVPDFRVIREDGFGIAVTRKVCWLCGQQLGRHLSFVIGPMCAINRVTSEPPSHHECAEFAAKACPFLTRPMAKRSTRDLPEGSSAPAGIHLDRNPAATCLWNTRSFEIFRVRHQLPASGGYLIELGEPENVEWYAQGRLAEREEVQASIDGGYPKLLEIANAEGPEAVIALVKQVARMQPLMPPALTSAAFQEGEGK